MVYTCVVYGCSKRSEPFVRTLHVFPRDSSAKNAWKHFVNQTRADWSGPSAHSRLCSDHFTTACYRNWMPWSMKVNSKLELIEGSVPSIYPEGTCGTLSSPAIMSKNLHDAGVLVQSACACLPVVPISHDGRDDNASGDRSPMCMPSIPKKCPQSAARKREINRILESYATDASQDEHEAVFHVEPLSPPRLVSSTCDGERITEAEKDELAQQKLRTRKVKRVRSREVEKAERTKQKLETRKVKHVAMPEHNPLSKSALQEEMEQDAEMVKAGYPTMVEESPCLDSSMFAEIKQENTDEGCIEIKEEPIDFKTEGLRDGLKLPAETMEEAWLHTFKEESPSLDSSMATENKQECTDEGCIEIKEEPIDFKTEVLHDGLWSDKQPSEIPETKKSRTDFAGLGCEARGDIVKSLEDKKMNIYVDKDWIKSECAVNMNC